MDRTDSTDEMLNRALKLAYFIHNDKPTALRIVASALMRLETTAAAQDKRFYYTPIGRNARDREPPASTSMGRAVKSAPGTACRVAQERRQQPAAPTR